jgi:phage/plasmid-like protein (TIGR03299 family)
MHNLDESTGKVAFAYTGKAPWHGLGTQVATHMKPKEAIVEGGLNWRVGKYEMEIPHEIVLDQDGAGTYRPVIVVPDRFAIMRQDTNSILGFVGSDYQEVQNEEAFEPFEALFGKDAACIETVGALEGGKRIFAMAKRNATVEIMPGDPVEDYFLMTSSHDGTGSVLLLDTPIRVVCQNTLVAALKGCRNAISVKHTKNVKVGLKKATEFLAQHKKYWEKVTTAYKFMAALDMNQSDVKVFLAKLFPGKRQVDEQGNFIGEDDPATRTQNQRENIQRLFEGQATGANLAGKTRWGMFNAVTHWIDHERKGRNGLSAWENSVLGLGGDLRQEAFDILVNTPSFVQI